MGTNFYARIIPTKERKQQIKEAIDNDDFERIKTLVNETYSSPNYLYDSGEYAGGEIHLGKRSGGWKFLWNPNWYKLVKGHIEEQEIPGGKEYHWVKDGFDVFKYYDLTKESLKKFIDREDVVIYDEYDKKQNKDEFFKMAIEWGYDKDNEGWDGETYEKWEAKQNTNYTPHVHETEYSKFLEECGIKLRKYKTDFYSDGIRFAAFNEFI